MKKTISATVTPLMQDGSLDKAGLKKIYERNIRHGLDGIFILGRRGENHADRRLGARAEGSDQPRRDHQ